MVTMAMKMVDGATLVLLKGGAFGYSLGKSGQSFELTKLLEDNRIERVYIAVAITDSIYEVSRHGSDLQVVWGKDALDKRDGKRSDEARVVAIKPGGQLPVEISKGFSVDYTCGDACSRSFSTLNVREIVCEMKSGSMTEEERSALAKAPRSTIIERFRFEPISSIVRQAEPVDNQYTKSSATRRVGKCTQTDTRPTTQSPELRKRNPAPS
jgi:hypothetical protein